MPSLCLLHQPVHDNFSVSGDRGNGGTGSTTIINKTKTPSEAEVIEDILIQDYNSHEAV